MKAMKIFLNCAVFMILTSLISCEKEESITPEFEPHSLVWSQIFGGSDYDIAESVQQTTDGGYILAGWTSSYGAGNRDAWLIKTDATGTEQWNQTFGGSNNDAAKSVQQTTDGGYILAGWTESYGTGNGDAWLIKTDATGTEQWNQAFGGSDYDMVKSVQQTTDGGYILAGYTESYGAGNGDAWLIKTDAAGVEQWSQTFGGSDKDRVHSVQQTTDGGYILTGYTCSYGAGDKDAWLIKTDATGIEQWSQTFGSSNWDEVRSVQQTTDGGYILAGFTSSYQAGYVDAWLIKTDVAGTEQWSKTFGGSNVDAVESVQQTTDGGYILAGCTWSYGVGTENAWLIKTDVAGTEQWSKTLGDFEYNWVGSIQQTTNGNYILAGYTESYEANGSDAWLVKIRH